MKRKMTITWLIPVLGLAAAGLRSLLLLSVDERGLVPSGHPIGMALLGLTVLAFALAVVPALGKQEGDILCGGGKYAALGTALMVLGLGATVLTAETDGTLMLVWKVLGLCSLPALCWAAWCRWQGKKPDFLAYAPVCVFLILHMISRYRPWSGNPQWAEYGHELLGMAGLLLFAYQMGAAALGMENRRVLVMAGLVGSFCCLAAMPFGYGYLLCLGGAFWMMTECGCLQAAPGETNEERKDEHL